MKKSAILRIVIWSVVAVLLIGILLGVLVLSNNSKAPTINIGDYEIYKYDNENEYTVGASDLSAEAFTSINVDWINGRVNVIAYNGDTVKIEETSADDIEEKHELRWRVKENTLYIKPCKSSKGWNFVNDIPTKELYVYIPEDLAVTMNRVQIDTASAEISVTGISATKIDTTSASGNTWLEKCNAADMDVESVSGYVNLTESSAEKIDAETVSGNVEIMGTVKDLSADSISGTVLLCTSEAPQSADISTISGSIIFQLPDNDGFNIDLDTVSGRISSDFPLTMNNGSQTYGDGSRNYDFETVSGDINIEIK